MELDVTRSGFETNRGWGALEEEAAAGLRPLSCTAIPAACPRDTHPPTTPCPRVDPLQLEPQLLAAPGHL